MATSPLLGSTQSIQLLELGLPGGHVNHQLDWNQCIPLDRTRIPLNHSLAVAFLARRSAAPPCAACACLGRQQSARAFHSNLQWVGVKREEEGARAEAEMADICYSSAISTTSPSLPPSLRSALCSSLLCLLHFFCQVRGRQTNL